MSKTEQEKLGKRLWTIRRARDWTQERMARSIGISRIALSHAENGKLSGERSRSLYLIKKFLDDGDENSQND